MRTDLTTSQLARAINVARHTLRDATTRNNDVRTQVQRYVDYSVRNGESRMFAVLSAANYAVKMPANPAFALATLETLGIHPDESGALPPRVRAIFQGAIVAAIACTASHYIGRAGARDFLNDQIARMISDPKISDNDRIAALEAYHGIIGDQYGDYAARKPAPR